MKLVVAEYESTALNAFLAAEPTRLASSRIARVEVMRAVRVSTEDPERERLADALLDGCALVDPTQPVIRRAARLSSLQVRTLDAIHLATAESIAPDLVVAYDRRLAVAAEALGLAVATPGAKP